MRRHIAKSLQARSKAVRNAIDAYNEVAAIQDPRKPLLAWEEVVEYAFLSDFDLLRDSEGDVQRQPWARLAYRTIMDKYFRLERAREEIKRLNLEIPRFITWIRDEPQFLCEREAALRDTTGKSPQQVVEDLLLAVQVAQYRCQRQRFDGTHMRRFRRLSQMKGFSGSITPGVALEHPEYEHEELHVATEDEEMLQNLGGAGSDDEGDEAHEEEVSDLVYQMTALGIDQVERGGEHII